MKKNREKPDVEKIMRDALAGDLRKMLNRIFPVKRKPGRLER